MGRSHQGRLLALLILTGGFAVLLARMTLHVSTTNQPTVTSVFPLENVGWWIVSGLCVIAALGSTWWFVCTGLALIAQARVTPQAIQVKLESFISKCAPKAVRTALAATMGASMSMGVLPALASPTLTQEVIFHSSTSATSLVVSAAETSPSVPQDGAQHPHVAKDGSQHSSTSPISVPQVGMKQTISEPLDDVDAATSRPVAKTQAANTSEPSEIESGATHSDASALGDQSSPPHVGFLPRTEASDQKQLTGGLGLVRTEIPDSGSPDSTSNASPVAEQGSQTMQDASNGHSAEGEQSVRNEHAIQSGQSIQETQDSQIGPISSPQIERFSATSTSRPLSQDSSNSRAPAVISSLSVGSARGADNTSEVASSPSSSNSTGVASSHRAARTVVVQSGDSLWEIAAKLSPQGASNQHIATLWQSIYHANAEAIGDDPDLIYSGMLLSIP